MSPASCRTCRSEEPMIGPRSKIEAMLLTLILTAVAIAAIAAAEAQTERRAQTADESALATAMASANTACGAAIAVDLAPASGRGAGVDVEERSLTARRCRDAVDAIRSVCMTPTGRAAIGAQIRRLTCSLNSEPPAATLQNGVLDYRIDPAFALNDRHMVFDYLVDHLEVEGQPLVVMIVRPLEEAAVANEVAQTNRQCGTTITTRLEWSGVMSQAVKERTLSNYCSHALDAVARVCTERAGQEAVARKVKHIVCGYAPARSVSLRDGVLEFMSDFKSPGDRGVVFEYLQNTL